MRALNDGQQQLHGGITHVAEAQAAAQARLAQSLETRLAEVTKAMGDSLEHERGPHRAHASASCSSGWRPSTGRRPTSRSCRATCSGCRTSCRTSRPAAPSARSSCARSSPARCRPTRSTFQATLSTGVRADCLIHLPQPPGPIVIDAKFPLEPYEALRAAKTPAETQAAQRLMRGAVRAHMKAIAEKYVIEGETAEGALMFLPSEAVYAELHANFGDLVREGFGLRVWIVSPTTCMATLHTLRAVLKDARLRAEAHTIRRELGLLHKDVERLAARVGNLDRHFSPGAEGHRGDPASPPTARRAAPAGSRRSTSPRRRPSRRRGIGWAREDRAAEDVAFRCTPG